MLGLCFGTDIEQKTLRLFVFEIKTLYLFSPLLSSTVFEHNYTKQPYQMFWKYSW